jgi:hypothetical protein
MENESDTFIVLSDKSYDQMIVHVCVFNDDILEFIKSNGGLEDFEKPTDRLINKFFVIPISFKSRLEDYCDNSGIQILDSMEF